MVLVSVVLIGDARFGRLRPGLHRARQHVPVVRVVVDRRAPAVAGVRLRRVEHVDAELRGALRAVELLRLDGAVRPGGEELPRGLVAHRLGVVVAADPLRARRPIARDERGQILRGRVRLAAVQVDEEQLARLQGAIPRGGDRDDLVVGEHLGVVVGVRHHLGRDVAGLEVAVRGRILRGQLVAEGLLHARHVGVHHAQVPGVDPAHVHPLGVEQVTVGQQRRRDAVGDVAGPELQVGAAGGDGADLGGHRPLVLVLELHRARRAVILDVAVSHEGDAIARSVDRVDEVVAAAGQLLQVRPVEVDRIDLIVAVAGEARREDRRLRVEREVVGLHVRAAHAVVHVGRVNLRAGRRVGEDHRQLPVGRRRREHRQPSARHEVGVVEDVAVVVARRPLQERDRLDVGRKRADVPAGPARRAAPGAGPERQPDDARLQQPECLDCELVSHERLSFVRRITQ